MDKKAVIFFAPFPKFEQIYRYIREEEEDDRENNMFNSLRSQGQQSEEKHVGSRMGDELHKRIPHKPGHKVFTASFTCPEKSKVP